MLASTVPSSDHDGPYAVHPRTCEECQKSPHRTVAHLNGSKEDLRALLAREQAERHRVVGAGSRELAAVLAAPDREDVSAQIVYRGVFVSSNVANRAAVIRRELRRQRQSVLAALSDVGAQIVEELDYVPYIRTRASTAALRRIVRHPDVVLVDVSRVGTPAALSPSSPRQHEYIDAAEFNQDGVAGNLQNVGVLEPFVVNRGVWKLHEALQDLVIFNQTEPNTCSGSSPCGLLGGLPSCHDGFCIESHATHVVAAIAGTAAAGTASIGQYNAWAAGIWLANDTSACSPGTGYKWFVENDVKLINESFECLRSTTDGVVQDLHTRDFDMVVFLSG